MSPKVSPSKYTSFLPGRGWGREIKCSKLLSLLFPMGPPQQSENSWLAALPPSLSWLLVFLFLPAPLLGVEREDGQLRPNPCSMAHPAVSWRLSLGRRLWLVFYEVVRLSALSKPHPLPQTSCDQQGKVIYAAPKGHCGALLDLGGRGSSAEDIFFFFLTSA